MRAAGPILNSQRIVIFGNSGSGKSTLAGRLAARLPAPAIDLDAFHWLDEGYAQKRDAADARRLVAEAAAGPRWIIEGVYGWLADVALPRATALIWLDLPWSECRASLLSRGPRRGADKTAFDDLLAWGEAYTTRTTSSSHEGHRRSYDAFLGEKLRLCSRREVSDCLGEA